MTHSSDCSEDFKNVTHAHRQKETALNYAVIACLGTCVLMSAKSFMSPHIIFDAAIALGLATIVDASIDRIKNRKRIQDVETSFVTAHGNSYEKLWVRDLNEQEKSARRKNRIVSAITLSSIASACVVSINVAPEFKSIMLPAFAVAGSLLHGKTTKKVSAKIDEAVANRRTLVEQIHQRRSTDEPTPSVLARSSL